MVFQDLVGQKFNKLTVMSYIGQNKQGQSKWLCQCDCGKTHEALGWHLKKDQVKSCGCIRSESHIVHGWNNTPEWNSYHSAKKRCNPKFKDKYFDWSGRGIKFKFKNFQQFIDHIGPRPEPKFDYSLDRIDNDGHYEIGNVQWSTKKEQARNRRCDNCDKLKTEIEELKAKLALLTPS